MVTVVTPSTESMLRIQGVRLNTSVGRESLDWINMREKLREDVRTGSSNVRISWSRSKSSLDPMSTGPLTSLSNMRTWRALELFRGVTATPA